MPHNLSGVLRAVAATPWAILPEKLDAILDLLQLHAAGGSVPEEARRAYVAERAAQEARLAAASSAGAAGGGGQVAVLPLYGTIAQRMDLFMEFSGGTSTEAFAARFDAAIASSDVSAVVIDVDSPGGATTGVMELAARIHAARGRKPIVAVANSLMASAAYWIGAAADEVVVTPSGLVGSIGVFTVHTDVSGADAQAGRVRTLIRAGRFKAEGAPFEPLSEEAQAALQAMVDEVYGDFVGAVARYRGVTAAAVRGGFGEGRVLLARGAVESGLADRVATLDEVLAELTGGRSSSSSRSKARGGSRAEDTSDLGADAPNTTPGLPARGGAETTSTEPPHRPAPRAMERTVDEDEVTTAAAPGGATVPAGSGGTTTAAASTEPQRIAALAREHGLESRVGEWILAGRTSAQVRDEIMASYRDGVRPVRVAVGQNREAARPWASFGEQLLAVRAAHPQIGGAVDPRLLAGPTGMNQSTPSEGGFLVGGSYSQSIWDGLSAQPGDLLSRTDQYTVEGAFIEFNANAEKSRKNGSRYGGVQGYWLAEADQLEKSRPKFRRLRLEPNTLGVLVYMTERLDMNSPIALEQYVSRAASEEISFMSGDAIFGGKGAGKPQGFVNSGAKITVAKENGQAAATINPRNVSKMWSRLHPRSRANAVWLHNIDVEPQFDAFSTTVTNVAGTENVGGYGDKLYNAEKNTLKGRPLIPCEFCETLGTEGDLVLVDLSVYATGTRGAIREAASIHVRFEYAENAFRFLYDIDGQNWLATPLEPYKGNTTLSNIVTLATRG